MRIPATSFVDKQGATLNDATNGLSWLSEDDWVKYEIELPEAGQYTLEARISSPLGDGAFSVINPDTDEVYASINTLPITTTWDEYATVKVELTLPKNRVSLTLQVVTEGWSLLWLVLREIENAGAPPNDSVSIPDAPTNTVPAVQQNITSNSTRSGNLVQPPFRTMLASATYQEMKGMLVEESTEGLKNLYWIDRGDSVTYNVQLPMSGVFLFKARISSPDGTGAFQVRNKVTDETYASVTELPSTGSFQTWETITTTIELPAGDLMMEILALSQGWNLLWIVLELQPESSPLIDVTSPVVFETNSTGGT